MTTKLFLPVLLVAACGDNIHPGDDDDVESGTEEGGSDAPVDGTPARAINASILITVPSCKAPLATFETEVRHVDDNSLVTNISCLWEFDDGAVSTSCNGEHMFESGGVHGFVLEVTDLDTGAIDRVTQNRFIDPPIEANLDATGGNLQISWNATTNVGMVSVLVEPADLVITNDPFYFLKRMNTIAVAEPGTYTVTMFVEDERPVGPICTAEIVKHVEVTCSSDHVPD